MAAPEPSTVVWGSRREAAQAAARPSATVLPMRPVNFRGSRVITEASGGRIGPARGLALGLCLGLTLWGGIIGLAASFLR